MFFSTDKFKRLFKFCLLNNLFPLKKRIRLLLLALGVFVFNLKRLSGHFSTSSDSERRRAIIAIAVSYVVSSFEGLIVIYLLPNCIRTDLTTNYGER